MTAADSDRDTIPPSPAGVDEVQREILAAIHGAREDMARIGTGLAHKIDSTSAALEGKLDSLATTVADLSLVVVELDGRVGRIEDQVRRYADDLLAVSARVTALEGSRSTLTPMMESALVAIVPAVESIAKTLARGGKVGKP